jgi:hypothetical protein
LALSYFKIQSTTASLQAAEILVAVEPIASLRPMRGR